MVRAFFCIFANGYLSFTLLFHTISFCLCLLASYIPDFLVQLGNRVYMIETKADNQLQAANVQRKRRAAAEWCQRVSQASGQVWEYIVVGESLFYSLTRNGATFVDLCEQCKFSSAMAQGRLSF